MLTRTRALLSGSALKVELIGGGLGSLAIKTASVALAFAVAVTLARMLGPAGYGTYAFALAVLTIVALPAQVGLPQLVVRETAKAQADGDVALMRGLWRWSNRAVIVFSGLAMAGLICVLWLTEASPRIEMLAVGAILIPLIALGNLRAACLRGLRRIVLGQLPENVIRPIVMLAILLGATGLGLNERFSDPRAAMMAYVAAAVTAFVAGAAMLNRFRPLGWSNATPRTETIAWRRAVLPLAMIAGLQVINNQADIIVLGIYRSDEEVGVYRAVFQMALLVVFGFQAMNQMLQPHFARLYRQGEMERLQRLVKVSTRAIAAMAMPPVLAYIFFGGGLLALVFGDQYRVGAAALAILALGQGAKAAMGSSLSLLNMTGHERVTAWLGLAAVLLNIVLNFVLVPTYGGVGAAAATCVSSFAWCFSSLYWLKCRLSLRLI